MTKLHSILSLEAELLLRYFAKQFSSKKKKKYQEGKERGEKYNNLKYTHTIYIQDADNISTYSFRC